MTAIAEALDRVVEGPPPDDRVAPEADDASAATQPLSQYSLYASST
jgi:hypothetical protein